MNAENPTKPTVILDPHHRKIDEIFEPHDLERLHQLAHVVWGKDEIIPPEEFDRARPEAYAVITGRWRYGSINDMPKLRAVLEVSGRHPSPKLLDYAACFARGIRVLSCAPAFGPMVAEMALGLAIAAGRGIVEAHEEFRAGRETYGRASNAASFTLFDQPVGFIGYGGLARNLRPLLAPFRCPIQVYDPWLPATHLRRQGLTPVGLNELLRTSRVIFVLAIPSLENRALLDRERLEWIRPDAVLALISRSHLVDFDALTDLLMQRRFRAVIDVFPQEPLPLDHPIRNAPGVILSAHRAGSVWSELRSIGRMVVDDLEAMIAGLPPLEMQSAQPEIIRRLD
jgi:phosphoglycerate dehydrogenase-like enzyme